MNASRKKADRSYGRHRQRGIPTGTPPSQFDAETGKKIHPATRAKTKGNAHRRHLVTGHVQKNGRTYEYSYHATKGWRRVWVA